LNETRGAPATTGGGRDLGEMGKGSAVFGPISSSQETIPTRKKDGGAADSESEGKTDAFS